MNNKNQKRVLQGKIALLEEAEKKRGLSDTEDGDLRVARDKLHALKVSQNRSDRGSRSDRR